MASKVTSASDRSKRAAKSKAKVSGTTPTNRATRQKAANAKITKAKSPSTTPRSVTNAKSPVMRQLHAKAIQAQRQAAGKSVIGGVKGKPLDPGTAAKIKAGAQKLRVEGDSGKVRAAQKQGKLNVEKAQRSRARMAAGVGRAGMAEGAIKAVGKALPLAAVAAATLNAGKVADGTLKGKPVRPAPRPKPGKSKPEEATKASFDKSFKKAKVSGSKVFMYKGKRYTTKRKDGK